MFLIINAGSEKTPEIAQRLLELNQRFSLKSMDHFFEEDVAQADAIIISGAPILLSEEDPKPYLEKFKFIKTLTKPVLGICFGHQIIGMLFGAKIFMQAPDRSNTTISLFNSPLFSGLGPSASFAEDHCESINLPDGFIKTGSSTNCKIESMEHKTNPIYGVQFHPEVSGENGHVFFKNLVSIFSGR